MKKEKAYFGDLHNHCNISYGHGSFEDSVANAKQGLDFCSITGHAHWCDMPKPNERIGYIIDFHKKGFDKLKNNWKDVLKKIRKESGNKDFVLLPGFEIHSCADGDYTIIYFEDEGEILYSNDIEEMKKTILELQEKGIKVFAFPHHIGYKQGARGINWKTFDSEVSPIVEIYSMHGCSEDTESPFPFRHSMGPANHKSTVNYGLYKGNVFGFIASTDHHSAHPASYGQGCLGVWADNLSKQSLWEAMNNRRTFALTGDKIKIDFELDSSIMGSIRKCGFYKGLKATIEGGYAIDCVDIIKNNEIIKRISSCDMKKPKEDSEIIESLVHLEVGWGQRGKRQEWNVEFGITEGEITHIEPRFRGPDILSPVQKDLPSSEASSNYSKCNKKDSKTATFDTVTYGNATNTTPGTQGVCLRIKAPKSAKVFINTNGIYNEYLITKLLKGGQSGYLIDEIDAPSWFIHRMPYRHEYCWDIDLHDFKGEGKAGDFIYLRVRQQNMQYAWASPVFIQ